MNNLHNIHELSSMIDISLEEALGAIEGRYEETEFHLKRDIFSFHFKIYNCNNKQRKTTDWGQQRIQRRET